MIARCPSASIVLAMAAVVALSGTASGQNVRLTAAPAIAAEQALIQIEQQLRAADGSEPRLRAALGPRQFEILATLAHAVASEPGSEAALAQFGAAAANAGLSDTNVAELVLLVMKQALADQHEDMRRWLEELERAKRAAQALAGELGRIAAHPCPVEPCTAFQTNARDLQTSFGSAFLTSPSAIAAYRAELLAQQLALGANSNMAMLALQTKVQSVSQTTQMMSNIAKSMNDAKMSAVRNMRN